MAVRFSAFIIANGYYQAWFWPAPSPFFGVAPGASAWQKLDEPRLNFLPKSPLGRPDSADLLGATVSDVFDGLQWYETVTLVIYHPGYLSPWFYLSSGGQGYSPK
jgi:hypothetical protein